MSAVFVGQLGACSGRGASPAPPSTDVPTSDPSTSTSAPDAGLSYWGFAVVDCGWDDPHDDSAKTNYVDELEGLANVGQLCVWDSAEVLAERLAAFDAVGVKALVHVELLFFDHEVDRSSPSGVRARLRPDAQARWERFVDGNADVLNEDHVAALYLVDEPVWNGVSAEELASVAGWVQASTPDLPSVVVEAYPVVDQLVVPESLDWVGFDRYDTIDPYTDPAWRADLETLRGARSRPDQKILIIADTQWRPDYGESGIQPADMAGVVERTHQVAREDPDVIGMVGYTWPGGLDEPEQLGARSLPEEVQEVFRDIAEEVL